MNINPYMIIITRDVDIKIIIIPHNNRQYFSNLDGLDEINILLITALSLSINTIVMIIAINIRGRLIYYPLFLSLTLLIFDLVVGDLKDYQVVDRSLY